MNDEILKRIDALATKLGTTAEHLWQVLIRQARIEAYEDIAWGVLWLIGSAFWALMAKGVHEHKDADIEPFIFCCGAGILFAVVALFQFAGTPAMLLNPEYWAFKEIAKVIGK